MKRSDVIQRLKRHQADLQHKFGVVSLAIFGSTARNEATPESDIDLLVEFNRPTGLFGLIDLQFYLEELLGTGVDVGTMDGLKPRTRERILKDLVYVS
ncbi:MAG: nucleotidyltransferase family protein [Chloroflexota bacterium]